MDSMKIKSMKPTPTTKLSPLMVKFSMTLGLLVLMLISLQHQFSVSTAYGFRAIGMFIFAPALATLIEVIYYRYLMKIKGKELCKTILNSGAWITGMMLTLATWVWMPFYALGVGVVVAIIVGKLLFGGYGHNIFSAACVGRVVIVLSFLEWLDPFSDNAQTYLALTSRMAGGIKTGGTITQHLGATFNWLPPTLRNVDFYNLFSGRYAGALGETFTFAIIAIGIIWALAKVIDWKIPAAILGTVATLTFTYALLNGKDLSYAIKYILLHWSAGGLMFGTIAMAPDPITAPGSNVSRIIYGIIIGFLVITIRIFGNFTEGVMFSILLANMVSTQLHRVWGSIAERSLWHKIRPVALSYILVFGSIVGITKIKQGQAAAAKLDKVLMPNSKTTIAKTSLIQYGIIESGWD